MSVPLHTSTVDLSDGRGIEDRTARKWMQEAGYMESAPRDNGADLNSRRDA